jgi:hypothetical protein
MSKAIGVALNQVSTIAGLCDFLESPQAHAVRHSYPVSMSWPPVGFATPLLDRLGNRGSLGCAGCVRRARSASQRSMYQVQTALPHFALHNERETAGRALGGLLVRTRRPAPLVRVQFRRACRGTVSALVWFDFRRDVHFACHLGSALLRRPFARGASSLSINARAAASTTPVSAGAHGDAALEFCLICRPCRSMTLCSSSKSPWSI